MATRKERREAKRAAHELRDQERHTIGSLNALFAECLAYKNGGYTERWNRNLRFYRGKQWQQGLPKWRAKPVVNMIFAITELTDSIMAGSDNKAQLKPMEGGDEGTATAYQHIDDYMNERGRYARAIRRDRRWGLKIGNGISKVWWDADSGPEGNVRQDAVVPYLFFPHPKSTCIEDAPCIFEAKEFTLAELRGIFSEKADLISDAHLGGYEKLGIKVDLDIEDILGRAKDWRHAQPTDNSLFADLPDARHIRDSQRVVVIEGWLRDGSLTDEPLVDDEGNQLEKDGGPLFKRKYPSGIRYVVWAGDVLFVDQDNPYHHARMPYTSWSPYEIEDDFWGMGEPDQLLSIQNEFNKRRAQIIDNANAMGNPVWIIDDTSGVDEKKVGNKPATILFVRTGTQARRDTPPALPAYVWNSQDAMKADMDFVSGMHEVMQGRVPQGVTSAAGIFALQKRAESRTIPKIKNWGEAMAEAAYLRVALYMQYWAPQRVKRVIGEEAYGKLLDSRILAEGVPHQVKEDEEINFTAEEIREQYDFFTAAEPVTQMDKASFQQSAIELAAKGMLGLRALYEILDWPNKDRIIKELEKLMPEKMGLPPAVPPEQLQAIEGGQGGLRALPPGPPSQEPITGDSFPGAQQPLPGTLPAGADQLLAAAQGGMLG